MAEETDHKPNRNPLIGHLLEEIFDYKETNKTLRSEIADLKLELAEHKKAKKQPKEEIEQPEKIAAEIDPKSEDF